jgi:hypothetical protein
MLNAKVNDDLTADDEYFSVFFKQSPLLTNLSGLFKKETFVKQINDLFSDGPIQIDLNCFSTSFSVGILQNNLLLVNMQTHIAYILLSIII